MPGWDDFTSEVRDGTKKKGPDCTVGAFIRGLDKLARIQVEAALGDRKLSAASIAEAMQKRGCTAQSHTVRRHRRGACGCPKDG